ncbi:MAG TPA: hypothetical protein VGI54_10260 [Solirubrobacteraceae bacterium]
MRRLVAVITLLCALSIPATALAGGGGDAVLRDCVQHGSLTKTYTQAQYQDALDNMPADLQEYSNCAEVIAQAKRSAAAKAHSPNKSGGSSNAGTPGGGGSGGGGSGGSSSSSGGAAPSTGGGGPPSAGGQGSSPGPGRGHVSDRATGSAPGSGPTRHRTVLRPLTAQQLRAASAAPAQRGLGSLPTPLIVVLALLALVALATLALEARRRFPELADAPLVRRVLPRRGA